jgi:membrane associated rhomboid family serine protease
MGYEDRDYFKSKARFEPSLALPPATRGLMIAVAACYILGLIAANNTSLTDPEFWALAAQPDSQQSLLVRLAVLTPGAVAPWGETFAPRPWVLLTHWLIPVSLFAAVVDVLLIFFAGRLVEPLLGGRRYLLMFVSVCVFAGLLAALTDPLIVRGRQSVIMGPTAGVFAVYAAMIWIAPNQPALFGLTLKRLVLIVLALVLGLKLVWAFSGGVAVASPTQIAWGAGLAAAYMSYLNRAGRVPSLEALSVRTPTEPRESWEREAAEAAAEARKLEAERDARRAAEARDRAKLDALLEKISREGMHSLTRAERKFLDEQAQKNRKN